VTESAGAREEPVRPKDHETREYLERVVAEAAAAEWSVYKKLPEVDLLPLEGWILPDGGSYKRIKHLAERHHERKWTLASPFNNPSTYRLMDARVVKLSSDEAWVRTTEYWYLRWWSVSARDYADVDYRETNPQKHVIVRRGQLWLIDDTIYPPPRTITPHRKKIVIG
jgi:hypothetical protein